MKQWSKACECHAQEKCDSIMLEHSTISKKIEFEKNIRTLYLMSLNHAMKGKMLPRMPIAIQEYRYKEAAWE